MTKRRIGAILILSTVLMALMACGHDAGRAKQIALQKGRQFYQKSNYSDAEIQFRKAIQEDARSGEAWLWFGRTENQRGNYPAALQALNQAVALSPGQEMPKVELANMMLVAFLGNPKRPAAIYGQVTRIADDLLAGNINSFDGIRLKGYLAMVDSQPAKAIDYFTNADRVRPNQPDVVTALAESLVLDGQKARAEQVARNFLHAKPAYGPLYTFLYQRYMSDGRVEAAEDILKTKVSQNPRESLYRIELANHYFRRGDKSRQSEVLNQLVGDSRNFPHAYLATGDFYADKKDWAEARSQYTQGAQIDPRSSIVYLKRLIRIDLTSGDRAGARQKLDRILKQKPDDLEAQASRAALRMASNDAGERKLAVNDFAKLVDGSLANTFYRFQYAEALRLSGETDAARAQYVQVLQKEPANIAALQNLADLSIRAQRIDEALEYAGRVLALDPASIRAGLVRSAGLASKGRLSETRSLLTGMLNRHPGLREAELQLALLDLEEKHYDEAEKGFRRNYQPGRGDARSLKGLVELYRARHQMDAAVALLQQDLNKGSESFEVRALLAKTAAEAGKKELAVAEYELVARAQPGSAAIAMALGQAYQASADPEKAVGEFKRATTLAPRDAVTYAFLAQALEAAGRKQEAIADYRQSLSLDSANPWVVNNLANLVTETGGDLNEALKLAEAAIRQYPGNLSFNDTLGSVYLRKRNFSSAIQIFQGVRDRNPKDVSFRIHLGQALLASGDHNQSREELRAAMKLPCTPEERETIERLLGNSGSRRY